jgi:chemotaxis response regulator CheB
VQIMQHVWSVDDGIGTATVTGVRRLRKRIEANPASPAGSTRCGRWATGSSVGGPEQWPGTAGSRRRPQVVVVGASAGGVEALRHRGRTCRFRGHDLRRPHLPTSAHSFLPTILSRAGALPVHHGRRSGPGRGTVYIGALVRTSC